MTIKHVDFGKSQRESARKLARLMDLCEQRSSDILANPEPYLKEAHERMWRVHVAIEEAQQASFPVFDFTPPEGPPQYEPVDTIIVERSEYERLKKAMELLRKIRV